MLKFFLWLLRFARAGLLKRRGSWQLSNGEVERPQTFPLGLNSKHCGDGWHVFVRGHRPFSRLMSEGKPCVPGASPGTRIFFFFLCIEALRHVCLTSATTCRHSYERGWNNYFWSSWECCFSMGEPSLRSDSWSISRIRDTFNCDAS